jgi:hypothetical protein
VRQTVVIADQITMKFDRLFNAAASFPVIFAESSLNSELTFYQITPRLPSIVHLVTNAEPLIDALEILATEIFIRFSALTPSCRFNLIEPDSFVTQRHQRIYLCGLARRQVACQQGHQQ